MVGLGDRVGPRVVAGIGVGAGCRIFEKCLPNPKNGTFSSLL